MKLHRAAALLLGLGLVVPAYAADLGAPLVIAADNNWNSLPAVSGVNGKFELNAGIIDVGGVVGLVNAGASISIPVGHNFGVQIDGAIKAAGDDVVYGGALHAFVRDPSSYLVGVTGAVIRTDGGNTAVAIGPELEFYINQLTIEVWGGYAHLDYNDPALADKGGVFVVGDVAWYATDNLRLAVGGSYILDTASLNLSAEYQLDTLPISLTARVSVDDDSNYTATIGFKGYFGAPSDRTLIERHRQDDPRNRVIDVFSGLGPQIFETAPSSGPPPVLDCSDPVYAAENPGECSPAA